MIGGTGLYSYWSLIVSLIEIAVPVVIIFAVLKDDYKLAVTAFTGLCGVQVISRLISIFYFIGYYQLSSEYLIFAFLFSAFAFAFFMILIVLLTGKITPRHAFVCVLVVLIFQVVVHLFSVEGRLSLVFLGSWNALILLAVLYWLNAAGCNFGLPIPENSVKYAGDFGMPVTHDRTFDFENKNIAVCIILSFLTCGIYTIFWLVSIIHNVHKLHGDYHSAAAEVLLNLFVPFYSYYWMYKNAKQMYEDSNRYHGSIPDNAALYIILALLGLNLVNLAIIQNEFNKFICRE